MKMMKKYGWLMAAMVLLVASCNQSGEKNAKTDEASAILLSNPANLASTVYMTTDERNLPMISWAEEDSTGKKSFYFARWNHATQTFAEPMEIPIKQNVSIHEEGMPKIAVKANGTIVATFEASVPQPGSRWGIGDIFYVQSEDMGQTWSEPKSIDIDKSATSSLSFSGLARLSDGQVGVSWLDTNPEGPEKPGRPVMFARTSSDESGFEKPVLIDKSACECCRIAITSPEDGRIAVAYRDLQPGNIRDISISTSSDGGKTFEKPTDFSQDEWEINGCPHNGPSIVSGNGKMYATWFTGGAHPGVHYAELDENGNALQRKDLNRNARFVQLTVTHDGDRIVAFNENYKEGDSLYSRIVLNKITDEGILEKKIQSPHLHGNFPMVQPFLRDFVVVAWRDGDAIYYQLNDISSIDQEVEEVQELRNISPLKNAKEMPGMKMEHSVTLDAQKLDPVCRMTLSKGQKAFAITYKGEKVYLCSDQCVQRFEREPELFLAKK